MNADNSENYLINMRDGRLILFTKQAIRQVDYHPISAEVAHAIGDGRITANEVISRIKANLLNNQDAWDDLLSRKTTMNVRKSLLKPEDAEGIETAASPDDMKGAFKLPDGEIPTETEKTEAPKTAAKAASKKQTKKDAPAPEAPAEEVEPDESGVNLAESLTI